MAKRIQFTPAARALYTNDGRLKELGEPMRQADYGRTLRALARDGARAFYQGDIAERIAADFQAHGGFITRADLAAYRAEVAKPLANEVADLHLVDAGPQVLANEVKGVAGHVHDGARRQQVRLELPRRPAGNGIL